MMTKAKLYYESHVTIEPVFDEDREIASRIASAYGFKLADLLMQKRSEDTPERSAKDTFMTGHGKDYDWIVRITVDLVLQLQKRGFKVWRYKIEDTMVDSRAEDVFGLLNAK